MLQEWTRWALETPKSTNPILDDSGKFSHLNQPSDPYFLGGTFGTDVKRKIIVPDGKRFFFPILAKECSFAEEGEQIKTEEGLVQRAQMIMDKVRHIYAKVDGVPWEPERQCSGVFDLTFPKDNVYNIKPGPTRSVIDGYWVLLPALNPRTIEFGGTLQFPNGEIADLARRFDTLDDNDMFTVNVKYELKTE